MRSARSLSSFAGSRIIADSSLASTLPVSPEGERQAVVPAERFRKLSQGAHRHPEQVLARAVLFHVLFPGLVAQRGQLFHDLCNVHAPASFAARRAYPMIILPWYGAVNTRMSLNALTPPARRRRQQKLREWLLLRERREYRRLGDDAHQRAALVHHRQR